MEKLIGTSVIFTKLISVLSNHFFVVSLWSLSLSLPFFLLCECLQHFLCPKKKKRSFPFILLAGSPSSSGNTVLDGFSFSSSEITNVCSNQWILLPSWSLSLSASLSLFLPALSLSPLQMDVVYTFQTGQTTVPGALRRQPSVVSQQNDAKTVSSPTHVGISSSSLSANSAAACGPSAPASSSTAGSEWQITPGKLTAALLLHETHHSNI